GTYGAAGAFTHHAAIAGLLLSPVMIAGSYVGKRIVDRIPEWVFVAVVEIVLVVFGVFFLVAK
ncbi:MAG: sulfite exporter TauE/SafE family protein, partial [Deltaproteobacteria bacterium]|nr:sulfite exporter TauE/SafE family protein [Deltaproteobacteria bacterium]